MDMDEDEVSVAETAESLLTEKQRVSLQSYLDSVPYECESYEEMQKKLEGVVEKIYVCARAKNWLVLSTWDGMLQCWILMRYPMPITTRAKLVRLYYALSLLPGIEPRVIRSWTDMVTRVLSNKPGLKRKLEISDLQLPWQPLWRALKRELWPTKRMQDSSRNVANILLFLAEHCRWYFPAEEVPNMLDTFLPLLTGKTIMTMIPVLTSFLPPTSTDLYLPALFRIWEAFNSSVLDDRLMDFAGVLSQELVCGADGSQSVDGLPQHHYVGIWSEWQWDMLVSKGLVSMDVPIGSAQGFSTTAPQADSLADKGSSRVKKPVNRQHALAKIIVHSIAVDGDVRDEANPKGYVGGSRALDALDRLITSTEPFFHPSNSGAWTHTLTAFLYRLTSEFMTRVNQEELETCKTPVAFRITPGLRHAFVSILQTPALLAMFSKDSTSMSYAQESLKALAILEPDIIMPELLERAYSGLEVVNETHRTTAVLGMLSGIARPLVTEKIWLGGQKHLLPLLELSTPGIDLNDPAKTMCATMFIASAVQHIKLGDLTKMPSKMDDSSVLPGRDRMSTDDGDFSGMSVAEERSLVRDSTSGFADWVAALVRRVFALYENLPEEGGKKNTIGGKAEEGMLKAVKGMMDIVCLHLSDDLFSLVLNLVYDYTTTNAKSNSVQAIGELVACLAHVQPERTLRKFVPHCISQIEEELKHGASDIRTTSSHAALPSDTTLHWNLSVLRGCLGHCGAALLPYRQRIIEILTLLVEKTKTERGYTATGRLLTRIVYTVSGVYPSNSRFVNSDLWHDHDFDRDHNLWWGRLYNPEDVVVEWHVPSREEIDFVLEILDKITRPLLNRIESLLDSTSAWDSAARNDFCRFLLACRSIWGGLATICQEHFKDVVNPCIDRDAEVADLLVSSLDVKAGFALTDPDDPRYKQVAEHRRRFGAIAKRAASLLRQEAGAEDHIDAVIAAVKAVDTYLTCYGLTRKDFDAMQKNYAQARNLIRTWPGQKANSRIVQIKRAHTYHSGRLYMHALYRRRSALDDDLLNEIVELSLSPYTRIRRQAQSVFHTVCKYYVRSTRYALPMLFGALKKGNDPDRMKGALFVLGDKSIASYALGDINSHTRYLTSLLECQHEEKQSIQTLVSSIAEECASHLYEEAFHTDAYCLETPSVDKALLALESEFPKGFVSPNLLAEALRKRETRVAQRGKVYRETVTSILAIAKRSAIHWRYVQISCQFLSGLLCRNEIPSIGVVEFLLEQSLSPQPAIRGLAQRAMTRLLAFIKGRTYSKSQEELWREEWQSAFSEELQLTDPSSFLQAIQWPSEHEFYVDKIRTGFLSWTKSIKVYRRVKEGETIPWDYNSHACLQAFREQIAMNDYFQCLSMFWAQESGKESSDIDMRKENVIYIKSIAKMIGPAIVDEVRGSIEALIGDNDKFKQRAGGELLAGLFRGSKHWPESDSSRLREWAVNKLDSIYAQIKPDTLSFWEGFCSVQLRNRDPLRNKELLYWITSLSIDFKDDSMFAIMKPITILQTAIRCVGLRFLSQVEKYVNFMFENFNTAYNEIGAYITQVLASLMQIQWRPIYPSVASFLSASKTTQDPLHIREANYLDRIDGILSQLPRLRESRLPPPRVSQSEYDRIGLTLLQLVWAFIHAHEAPMIVPYVIPMMPEMLQMSELNDDMDLRIYSAGVLYMLSAVPCPAEFIRTILDNFVAAVQSSTSWRIRLHALPALVIFFYRNLMVMSEASVSRVMDVLLECLGDENVEVRGMASKVLSGVIRCSQRQNVVPLKERFVKIVRRTALPPRKDPGYGESLRALHSGILGLCALIESSPYSVEPWMPPLTEVLALHATDPPPISTTIQECASEFKKTHQDTWHKDQLMFNEDQLQSLSTMLVGTSYYA